MRALHTWRDPGQVACALAALLALGGLAPARGQCPPGGLSGSISTCTEDGGQASGDAFDHACDAYLRAGQGGGGPGGGPKAGLPPGDYLFQVTDPSGSTLLSLDGPANGVLSVAAGQGGFSSYAGSHQAAGDGAAGTLRVQLCPVAATPNPGGVYKVWLTRADCYEAGEGTFGFHPSRSKTHTFKVTGAPPAPRAAVVIRRFCDGDADGDAAGEPLQDGVRYMVSISTVDGGQPFAARTGSDGPGTARIDAIPTPATYTVCELVPAVVEPDCAWYGIVPVFAVTAGSGAPACYTGTLGAGDVATLEFGAACVCPATDGLSRWAFLTPEGEQLLEDDDPRWRHVLADAQLVEADGSRFTLPRGSFRDAYATFARWLKSDGTANTAYALSTEVAAMRLAEHFGALDTGRVRVLRPDMGACLDLNAATPRPGSRPTASRRPATGTPSGRSACATRWRASTRVRCRS
jgi:hypothetical protein